MASQAVFGFVGVILGSLTTSVLTIYRERLLTRREQAARDERYERDRKAVRDTFQRGSILALQEAVYDLIRAVYQELDRVITEFNQTGNWPARLTLGGLRQCVPPVPQRGPCIVISAGGRTTPPTGQAVSQDAIAVGVSAEAACAAFHKALRPWLPCCVPVPGVPTRCSPAAVPRVKRVIRRCDEFPA
jgi:hypothetical protein